MRGPAETPALLLFRRSVSAASASRCSSRSLLATPARWSPGELLRAGWAQTLARGSAATRSPPHCGAPLAPSIRSRAPSFAPRPSVAI